LERLIARGCTHEAVASVAGMQRSEVTAVLGILRLPPEILADYRTVCDRVTRSTLCELACVEDASDMRILWKRLRCSGLTFL